MGSSPNGRVLLRANAERPRTGFEIILDVEAEIGALFVEERHGLSPLDSIARTAFSAVPTSNMQEDWQNSPLSQPPETVKPGVGLGFGAKSVVAASRRRSAPTKTGSAWRSARCRKSAMISLEGSSNHAWSGR